MRSAYISHSSVSAHEMGDGHPECPQRVGAIADRLIAVGLLDLMERFEAPAASDEQLARAHSTRYVDALRSVAPQRGYAQLDPDTSMNPHTWQAALHAAGAGVRATELVIHEGFSRAFCNVRPPGHHAMRDRPMGFCFFNSIAVAAYHALEQLGVPRVAIIDFDVHHGNGTEDIFAGDPRVVMLSTFQSPLYPYSGEQPLGSNMHNVALPPNSDGAALREAVHRHWLPVLDQFKPQLILVSAGFDAHRDDPLAQLRWVEADYAWVTGEIVRAAHRHSDGRVVSMLEGGYDLAALARSAESHLRALLEV